MVRIVGRYVQTAGVLFTDLDVVTGAPASTQTDAARLVRLLDRMDQSKVSGIFTVRAERLRTLSGTC